MSIVVLDFVADVASMFHKHNFFTIDCLNVPNYLCQKWLTSEFSCWLVVLRIYIASAVFQPYRNLEAEDNQSLKIQVARPGIEPQSSCSASQELNHSATPAPLRIYLEIKTILGILVSHLSICLSLYLSVNKFISALLHHLTFNKDTSHMLPMSEEEALLVLGSKTQYHSLVLNFVVILAHGHHNLLTYNDEPSHISW